MNPAVANQDGRPRPALDEGKDALRALPGAEETRPTPALADPSVLGAGPAPSPLDFASYLARKYSITGDLLAATAPASGFTRDKKLRDLWELTDLSANDFATEVARFYELPRVTLPELIAATPLTTRFSRRFLRQMAVFPCQLTPGGPKTLVAGDPNDRAALRATELVLGAPVTLRIASFEDIATILAERLGESEGVAAETDDARVIPEETDIENLRDLASGAPVVRAVNDLLEKAVELRATDIHIEPFRAGLTLRMRVDGILRDVAAPPDVVPQALISRVKILAGLNIAERRLPQDGAAHLRIARTNVDIRVATMPTQYGESAVVRLLPKDRGVLELAKLGLAAPDERKLSELLTLPHGIIVVTGPTGSGKTTTLATMLTVLNDRTRKILTIEDPVEYDLPGVNQSQVRPSIGLTFAAALRAFVRQDPDVIMVGEIRDAETAHIAIHAALTGHLVLTTLHTETAAAAVPRLLDLGVESFLLRSTLRAVIAQRLVRVLCERCKTQRRLCAADIAANPRYAALGLAPDEVVHEARGCERCSGTGFRGRTGVFEVIEANDEIRALIGTRTDSGTITASARRAGMTTMFEHAVAKCRAGITTAAEVFRVTTMR